MTDVEDNIHGFHSHYEIQNREIGCHFDHHFDSLKYYLDTNWDMNPFLIKKVTRRSRKDLRMAGKSNIYKEDD